MKQVWREFLKEEGEQFAIALGLPVLAIVGLGLLLNYARSPECLKEIENSRYPPEYRYSGKIGEDHVDFRKDVNGRNTLAVRKPDGRGINYFDIEGSDLKLESIITTEGDRQMIYSIHDNAGKSILGEAQRQFDTYMEQIKQAKISKALEDLK